jgi:hypothetical protein
LAVCIIGFALYLIPMFIGMSRGEPAGRRDGGWKAAPITQKDSLDYMEVARDLSDFRQDQLHLRTVGYPLILLATGSSESPHRALYFVSLLFHLATVLLLGAVLNATGVSRWWTLAMALFMWLPPMVEPAAFVMTENAVEFCLVLGLAGVVLGISKRQWGWLIAGGIGLSYCGLVHPTYQVVCLCALGVLVLSPWCLPWARVRRRQVFRAGLALGGAFVLIVGGMVVINKITLGFAGLSPFTGYTLTSKTVRVVEQLPDEYGPVRDALVAARDADLTTPNSSHMAASYFWRAKDEVGRITHLEGLPLANYFMKLNLRLIKEAPLSYLQEVCLTVAAFWSPTSGQGLASFGRGVFHALWAGLDLLVITLFVCTLMAMTGLAVVVRLGRFRSVQNIRWSLNPAQVRCRTMIYALGFAVIFYTTLIVGLFGAGISRYRAPIMPLVLVLAILGIEQLWRMFRAPQSS